MRVALTLVVFCATLTAQTVDPSVAGHVRRGVAAREAGRLEEAQSELESAVKSAPRLAEAHLFLGLVLHEREDFSGAEAALSMALSLKPDLPAARGLLGYDLLRLGRVGDAIPELERALEENPKNAQASGWLGQAFVRSGRAAEAVIHLEKARDASPTDPESAYFLGKALAQLSLGAQADLLAMAPDSAYAHLAVAEDHDLNGRTSEALSEYRLAIERNPALPGVWPAIGDIERDRGRNEAAAKAYRDGLEVEPEDPTVQLRYGLSLMQLGHSSEALPYLERAAKAEPPPDGASMALGKAQLDLNQLAQAETTFRQALTLAAGDQERMRVHYQLALLYQKQGEKDSAREHFRHFSGLRDRLTDDEK